MPLCFACPVRRCASSRFVYLLRTCERGLTRLCPSSPQRGARENRRGLPIRRRACACAGIERPIRYDRPFLCLIADTNLPSGLSSRFWSRAQIGPLNPPPIIDAAWRHSADLLEASDVLSSSPNGYEKVRCARVYISGMEIIQPRSDNAERLAVRVSRACRISALRTWRMFADTD
jgi:hypothetical protein